MSKARKRRKLIRWARYFNRYAGTVPLVRIGGDSLVDVLISADLTWRYIRRQQR